MRTKRFLFSALLIFLLIMTGCGVPDIDEIDQASLKDFTLSNTVPPNKPFNVQVVSGQSYATQFDTATNVPIVRLPNNLYGVQFDLPLHSSGKQDRELVAVIDVYLSGAAPLIPIYEYQKKLGTVTYISNFDYNLLFADKRYHFIIHKINERTGTAEIAFAPDTEMYFYDTVGTKYWVSLVDETVDVVYEYSSHYDEDAASAPYDPRIVENVPPLISWEAPNLNSDPQAGTPMGYRVFRNFPQVTASGSSTSSDWEALGNFDGVYFKDGAGSATNVDTRAKTWVHTVDLYGNDTQLTEPPDPSSGVPVPRQDWEEQYSYRIATVNQYGNTSVWTAPVTVRTVPPTAIPEIVDILVQDVTFGKQLYALGYPTNDSVDRDNTDYFLIYASYTPPGSISETQSFPALAKWSTNGGNLAFNLEDEIYNVAEVLPGVLFVGSAEYQIQTLVPRFVWFEAVDKWGNISRRSSLVPHKPSSSENNINNPFDPNPNP